MRRLVTAGLTAGLLMVGAMVAPVAQAEAPRPPGPGPHTFTPAPVAWGPCEAERLAQAGAECGFVEVYRRA